MVELYSGTKNVTKNFQLSHEYFSLQQDDKSLEDYSLMNRICEELDQYQLITLDIKEIENHHYDLDRSYPLYPILCTWAMSVLINTTVYLQKKILKRCKRI